MAKKAITKETILNLVKALIGQDAPKDGNGYMRKDGEWVPCEGGSIPEDLLERLERVEEALGIQNNWILADGTWNNDKSWNNKGFWNNGKKE